MGMQSQPITTTPTSCLPHQNEATDDAEALSRHYQAVRQASAQLCEPLVAEDYMLQSMPDASPTRWHLAHTTWFFETFILLPYLAGYRAYHPQFAYLFNSYYNAAGPRWPRPQRGMLSRPTVAEIFDYRHAVDEQMLKLLRQQPASLPENLASTLTLGCHHEQQHQELMLTDLKHAWAINPLGPVYRPSADTSAPGAAAEWLPFAEQLSWIGHQGGGFAYDNETPRHRTFVPAFQIASRLVRNRDFLAFIADDGYQRPELWLSEGWNTCQLNHWSAPLYWAQRDEAWMSFTLSGWQPLMLDGPVCHVSYFEADAFARWAGARLLTEAEWEMAAASVPLAGHFVEAGHFHPALAPAAGDHGPIYQLYGDLWQWTASAYSAYPGFRAAAGALGEYNGKFMCNQFVLRGASCATPRSHARLTYRNFFPPDARWQFTGIRLAKEIP